MSDDLYRLLVTRGYAQHEAHRIAFGPPYLDGSSPEPAAQPAVTLNGYQLREALLFACPDEDVALMDTEVRIEYGDGHSGIGHYVSMADYPDEGSILLDEKPQSPETKAGSES